MKELGDLFQNIEQNAVTSQKSLLLFTILLLCLREEYPDYSQDIRNDNALKARIELLDKVLAAEVDQSKLMSYDKKFYGKLPRDSI